MEDGNYDKLLSGCPCDDGQCGVHRRGSSGRDGGKVSEPSYQQRGGQQCQNLPADIGKQGDGAQLGSLVFGNEDAGERVIAESRAYGQTVRYRTVCQNQTDGCRTCQCSQYRHDGQEYQPRIE